MLYNCLYWQLLYLFTLMLYSQKWEQSSAGLGYSMCNSNLNIINMVNFDTLSALY